MGTEKILSVDEARELLLRSTRTLGPVELPLEKGIGHVLKEELHAPLDLPPFARSAMDGYAIRSEDLSECTEFTIVGSSDAGATNPSAVDEGEACRIHTGAPIPEGADAVVKQEDVERKGELLFFRKGTVEAGTNIRPKGEELKKGALALESGTDLTPAAIAFLASLGISSVRVYRKPSVAILFTGDELQRPGESLPPGSIYESNSFGIATALEREGFQVSHRAHVPDDAEKSRKEVEKALRAGDVLLLSGGISVGDRDHVKEALLTNGVEERFHKVRQKPGKPLFFGEGKDGAAFGLPGNPAASLVCLYEYTLPFLRACSGSMNPFPLRLRLPLLEAWEKSSDRTVFLKAKVSEEGVLPLEGQSSAMLRSFAHADALIHVPAGKGKLEQGELVEVDLL